MSEIFQLSETGVIDVVFAKSGAPSTVTPAPTFELRRVSDNALIDSGTLTAVGNAYPYTIAQAGAALYRLTATTSDAAADYPTYIDEARVGQTWIQSLSTIAADVWGYVTRTLTAGGLSAAAVWDYLTSLFATPGSVGELLLGMNTKLSSGVITVVSPADGHGNLHLVRYQSYLNSIGTRISITVPITVDPTGSTVTFTMNFKAGSPLLPFAGSVLSYDGTAGTATIGLELTSTQSGTLLAGNAWTFALGITLPAAAGQDIPISFDSGSLVVDDAPPP